MTKNYEATIKACFIGYITQAIVNNFVPLLFLTFQTSHSIPLSQITLLVTINFVVQLIVDILSIQFVDKIGYRVAMVMAHIFVVIGLFSLTILPDLLANPFTGIVISVMLYAIGGGLLEVLVSPVMESCPTKNKEKAMSLLHSFYCWGHVGVVLISTAFFFFIGISHWKFLALLWTLIPLGNALLFSRVPMTSLIEEDEKGLSIKQLLSNKLLWVLLLMMLCAGACEQAVSQWASTFAESGLHVTKTIGDLAGPMTFALLMGLSRAFYGKYGDRINLDRFMSLSTLLCLFSYLLISLSPSPVLSLVGCGLTGLSVGILWPGTFSTSAASLPKGGTAMFALLALAGDIGCATGPTLVGSVSSLANDNLKIGILSAIVFPALLFFLIFLCKKIRMSTQNT